MSARVLIVLAAFSLIVCSCKKEIIQPAEAEVIANQLQDIIRSEGITRVVAFEYTASFDNTSFFGSYGSGYSFDEVFVTIEDKAYNLTYLKKYEVRTLGDGTKYLGLYF